MRRLARTLLGGAWALLAAQAAAAVGNVPHTLITTNPAPDSDPAVSPDGKWLVFTSERGGPSGLYATNLALKTYTRAQPVAEHPARTSHAVFSPDGKWLAFESLRDDALGDIFLLRYPEGRVVRVTDRGSIDRNPRFSADGTRLLFQSAGIGEELHWHSVLVASPGAPEAADAAALLPQEPPYPLPLASASPAGGAVLLYSDDTNNDGNRSAGDDPTAWELVAGAWRQASLPIRGATGITRDGAGNLFVAAEWRDNPDVALLRDTPFRGVLSAAEQLRRGKAVEVTGNAALELRAVHFRAAALAADATPDEEAEARLEQARALNRLGRFWQASKVAEDMLAEEVSSSLRRRLRLQYLTARFEVSRRLATSDFSPSENLDGTLRELLAEFEAAGETEDAGEARLALGRMAWLGGNLLQAQKETEPNVQGERAGLSRDLVARTLLQRAEVFAALGLGPETRAVFLSLFDLDLRNEDTLEGAAARLIAIEQESAADNDARIIGLRNLAAKAQQYPWLLARVRMAEATRLQESKEFRDAERALEDAVAQGAGAPRPATDAAAELARLRARRNDLDGAVAALRQLEAALKDVSAPTAVPVYAEVREMLIDFFLRKGRSELLRGDPLLALATYKDLLAYDATLVQAWRGRIDAESRVPSVLEEALREYERDASAQPRSPLARYKLGLALSYPNPTSSRALREVRRAIRLDSSVPYFHLTEGYILQQQFDAAERGGRTRFDLLEAASDAFDQALALVDPVKEQQLHADILLNSANAAMGLRQSYKANALYRTRSLLPVGFADPRTELLFQWNYGIAGFRSADPVRAAENFARALRTLKTLGDRGLVRADRVDSIRAELEGRRALALMDAGRNREAIDLFASLERRAPADSIARVRHLRNQALLLEREAQRQVGVERARTLAQARLKAEEGLALVGSPTLAGEPSFERGSGLLNLSMIFPTDAVGGAAKLGFDARDEQRLLQATLGRLAQLQGDRATATTALERQLALDPKMDDTNRAYYSSARAVTLSRLAGEELRGGDPRAAAARTLEGLAVSRYVVALQEVINPGGTSLHLGKLAECLLRDPSIDVQRPEAFWMLPAEDVQALRGWALLDRAAEELLRKPLPPLKDPSIPLMATPEQRSRLLLVRALAQEQLALDAFAPPSDGLALARLAARASVHAAQAAQFAAELRTQAGAALEPEEAFRLAAIGAAVPLRLAAWMGQQEQADALLNDAREFAAATGQDHLLWWLEAQRALMERDAARRAEFAARSLHALEATIAFRSAADEPFPAALLDALEEAQLAGAVAGKQDAYELFSLVDRWRVVRLRWLGEDAAAPPATEEAGQWLRQFQILRREFREEVRALQRTPFVDPAREELQRRAATLAKQFTSHCEAAPEAATAVRDLLWPQSASADDVNAFAEQAAVTGDAFLLQRRVGSVAFRYLFDASPEPRALPAGEAPAAPAGRLFVLGDASAPLPEGAIQGLTANKLYDRLKPSHLRPTAPVLAWDAATPATAWRTALSTAFTLAVQEPVLATAEPPALWRVGASDVGLGEVLQARTGLAVLKLNVQFPDGITAAEQAAARLALAAWVDSFEVSELVLDGTPWLGRTAPLAAFRSEVGPELDVLAGVLERALAAEDSADATRAVERIVFLKDGAGLTEDLAANYTTLATLRGRLGRFSDATDAARRALELLEQAGGSDLDHADALRRAGDLAVRARRYDEGIGFYTRALKALQEAEMDDAADNVSNRLSVALENAGRYSPSIDLALALARRTADSNPELALAQFRRVARIQRLYQSRFFDAEQTLREALRLAEAKALAAELPDLRLNVARTLLSQARFEEALALLDALGSVPEPAAQEALEAEALLERANIFWLRSQYFESFNAQQRVLRSSAAKKNPALRVATHNVAGLTAWTVNDVERAFRELNQALEEAEKMAVDAEVATTANNIGLVHRSQRAYAEAEQWFRRALLIDEAQENRWGQAYALRNIGITKALAGAAEESLAPLARAVDLTTQIGDEVNLTKALAARGDSLLALGRAAEARADFEAAGEKARRIPIPEMQWRALHGLARVALAEKREDDALAFLTQAVDVVDAMRASIRVEEFQDGFLLDKQDLYAELISLLLRRGEVAAALEASEKSRGRNFIDLLGNAPIELGNTADEKMRARESELRRVVEDLERRIRRAPQDEAPALNEELLRARQAYTDFFLELRAANPQLSSFVRVEPVRVAELQKLVEPDTRLLIYHLLPDRMVCWVMGPESLELVEQPVPAEKLREMVLAARIKMQNFEDVRAELQDLSAVLVQPLLPRLEGVTRIGVVPHQELHTLPFAALPVPGGPDLIDLVSIYYVPSASVLRYTTARRNDATRSDRVLSVGNPDLGNKGLNLPFAQKEAERLAFDFKNIDVVTGKQATEGWLAQNLPNYGIVHIASHGEYRPDTPLFSALLLAPDGEENDGTLTSLDVFRLQMRADLVALSACQSGLGRVSKGDDIVGLNRAFVYAGTRQLLTTLWRVDDISTAVLFKYFYRLNPTTDRATALQQAQIRLKNRPEYNHPAHWSALVLSGDWK